MEQRRIYWEPLVSAAAVLIGIYGVMVPILLHYDNKLDMTIREGRFEMKEMNEKSDRQMRDFHERLLEIQKEKKG